MCVLTLNDTGYVPPIKNNILRLLQKSSMMLTTSKILYAQWDREIWNKITKVRYPNYIVAVYEKRHLYWFEYTVQYQCECAESWGTYSLTGAPQPGRRIIKAFGRQKWDHPQSISEKAYHSHSVEKNTSTLADMSCHTIWFCLVKFRKDIEVCLAHWW